jgi:hypothetical protein
VYLEGGVMRLSILLAEASVEQVGNRIPIWTRQYFNNDTDKALELLPDIIRADPTNGRYSEWLIKQWRSGAARFPEDVEKLSGLLLSFDDKKSRLDVGDINKYTPESLAGALGGPLKLTQREIKDAQHGLFVRPAGSKLVVDSERYKVLEVGDILPVTQLSSRTEWCVANRDRAEEYLDRGPLYFVYKDGKRVGLFSYGYNEFMNVENKPLPAKFTLMVAKLLESVTGFNTKNHPELRRLYSVFLVEHCRDVIGGRWLGAERAILRDGNLDVILGYARDVVFGLAGVRRWPEGERVVLDLSDERGDFGVLVRYAAEVIGERWHEAEGVMLDRVFDKWMDNDLVKYAERVVEGPWVELEGEILRRSRVWGNSPDENIEVGRALGALAANYAVVVSGVRWGREVEDLIRASKYCDDYSRKFRLDRVFCELF